MALLKAQDDVADDCQSVARLLDLRRYVPAGDLSSALLDLAKMSVETAGTLTRTTQLLADVPEGASPKEAIAETIRSADAVRTVEHRIGEARRTRRCSHVSSEGDAVGFGGGPAAHADGEGDRRRGAQRRECRRLHHANVERPMTGAKEDRRGQAQSPRRSRNGWTPSCLTWTARW